MKRSNHFSCHGKSSPRQLGYCGYVITVTHLYWVVLNLTLWIKKSIWLMMSTSTMVKHWLGKSHTPFYVVSVSWKKFVFFNINMKQWFHFPYSKRLYIYYPISFANKLIQVLGLDGCIQSPNAAILPILGESQIWIAATLKAYMLILQMQNVSLRALPVVCGAQVALAISTPSATNRVGRFWTKW